MPMIPGAGITPNFTISRAILSDAVALVRGDRFYTIDYNARNLTNWGYNEVQYDMGMQEGAVFYKLILRAFPNHFKSNSIYAHQPMTIPSENKKIQKSLSRDWHYSWDRPQRLPDRVDLASYNSAKFVQDNAEKFNTVLSEPLTWLASSDFKISDVSPFYAEQTRLKGDAVYQGKWLNLVKSSYEKITLRLLKEKSYKLAGINQVDITRDLGNLAPVHFVSDLFSLPLKTIEHTNGIYTERGAVHDYVGHLYFDLLRSRAGEIATSSLGDTFCDLDARQTHRGGCQINDVERYHLWVCQQHAIE